MSVQSPTPEHDAHSEHHVHFDDTITLKDDLDTENSVTYQKSGPHTIIVHLGFLQHLHRYHIDLRLPAKWLTVGGIVAGHNPTAASDKSRSQSPLRIVSDSNYETNEHCRLVEFRLDTSEHPDASAVQQQQQHYNFKVEYFAHAEHLLREELKMVSTLNDRDVLKFVITARVLGHGKGTPMLRNGIHCIGNEEQQPQHKQKDGGVSEDDGAAVGPLASAS